MPPVPHLPPTSGPRLVLYAQTHHTSEGQPISLLPLITQNTGVTHVIVAAIHLNDGPGNITLNDDPPSAEKFKTLWSEVAWLQGSGIKVLGMLGGAARGSFERLGGEEESFEAYYAPLRTIISAHNLDGLDLDVEEPVSLSAIQRLIHRLRTDFGPDFLITLAPVATGLIPDPNQPAQPRPLLSASPTPNPLHPTLPHLSGFSYPALENSPAGQEVSWYNTQFYCGWGDAGSTTWYDAIVAAGWDPRKVVVGVVTNPGNGAGYISLGKLREVLGVLRGRYRNRGGGFGGVMGWEYFNAGGGEDSAHLSTLSNGASGQAGWVGALGTVLRCPDPPTAPGSGTSHVDTLNRFIANLPTPAVAWPAESVDALVVIGFSKQEAVAALNATDGNVEMAAGLLFEN